MLQVQWHLMQRSVMPRYLCRSSFTQLFVDSNSIDQPNTFNPSIISRDSLILFPNNFCRHDVASAMTPNAQEVSCFNLGDERKPPGSIGHVQKQDLWRVEVRMEEIARIIIVLLKANRSIHIHVHGMLWRWRWTHTCWFHWSCPKAGFVESWGKNNANNCTLAMIWPQIEPYTCTYTVCFNIDGERK